MRQGVAAEEVGVRGLQDRETGASWTMVGGTSGRSTTTQWTGEEGRDVRPAHDPGMPMRDEVAKPTHDIAHLPRCPWRRWRALCVRGRSRCRTHRRKGGGGRHVSCDGGLLLGR